MFKMYILACHSRPIKYTERLNYYYGNEVNCTTYIYICDYDVISDKRMLIEEENK